MEGYGSDLRSGSANIPERFNGAVGGALVAKEAPPMETAMRVMAERLERLSMTVTHVEQRFCAVVSPEPPTPAQATDRAPRGGRAGSALAGTIEQTANQISDLTERLQSLLRRCEL